MKIRLDVVDMLREGHSHAHIQRTLHVSHATVVAARQHLGMPQPVAGQQPEVSAGEAFAARTEDTGDGHLRWTGQSTTGGTPRLMHRGQVLSGYRLAWMTAHQRDPIGRVFPGCGQPHCVAPAHQEDQQIRDQLRTQLRALFGEAA